MPLYTTASGRGNRTPIEGVRSPLYVKDNNTSTRANLSGSSGESFFVQQSTLGIASAKNEITPFKKFFGKKPFVGHLRVFGKIG